MTSGGGRSAGTVIPSVGSGRYAPGPNIALPSLLRCWTGTIRQMSLGGHPKPGIYTTVSFYLPAHRINLPYYWRLPYRVWHMGDKEVPGEQSEMGLRGSRAFFLGLLVCETPSLIDDALWKTIRHETTGPLLLRF